MSRSGWTLAAVFGVVVTIGVAWIVSRESEPARGRSPSTRGEVPAERRDASTGSRPADATASSANPAPSTAAAREISGIVRDDETGEGIAGATVRREGSSESATTDRFGRFRLAVITNNGGALVAEHPDFAPGRAGVDAAALTSDVELRLTPALTMSGRVVDAASGSGIEGAAIYFYRAATSAGAQSKSEADGGYRMRGVPLKPPPEPNEVRVEITGWELDRDALAQAMRDRAPESRVLSLDLPMRARASLEGRVIEPDGSPAVGAFVFPWLTPEGSWVVERSGRTARRVHGYDTIAECLARAGESGRFRIDDVPAGVSLTILANLEPFGDGRLTGVFLAPAEHRDGVELVLEPGSTIDGNVRSDAGALVGGAALTAYRVESATREVPVAEVASDTAGAFRIAGLAAGEWSVATSAKGFPPPDRTRVTLRAGETARIAIRLSSADVAISGRVTDSKQQPIAGARVVVVPENTSNGSVFVPVEVETDADGRYRAGGLESRKTFTVEVNGPPNGLRFAPASRRGVNTGSDDVDFLLHRAAIIRGTIRGLDPMPSWISVEARIPDPAKSSRALFARAGRLDGSRFEVADVMEGTYEVSATLADHRRVQRDDVHVAEGETVEGIDLAFGGGNAIRGRVIDVADRGIADADVILALLDAQGVPIDGSMHRTTTGPDGTFRFGDLAHGRYSIVASDAAHAPALQSSLVIPRDLDADDIILRLTQGGFIDGTVVDADTGRWVVGAHVGAVLEGERFPLTATTTSEGRFRIRVPAGRYVVVAMRGDDEATEGTTCEVQVNDGTEAHVTLSVRHGT
ncbi:MAG: carboxypeptidase regulatory-like domain-containing protein [Planctomycetes bacterium]|nr:carboxypeptidase regulatory-like domain-containing protein [Planctomycetota bacterium]MBI3846116.1 carboxypeptidase regulatory-like domain-containing protein [Planctomycetota bacterium]